MADNWSLIILALAVGWIVQYVFTYFQLKRFYHRLNNLKRLGTVSVGKEGTVWRKRVYAVLVVDENKQIKRVEQLSGWTTFASLSYLPGLEGYHLEDLFDDTLTFPGTQKQLLALQNAAKYILAEEQRKQEKQSISENSPGEELDKPQSSIPTMIA